MDIGLSLSVDHVKIADSFQNSWPFTVLQGQCERLLPF